jgi:hypothetical protein
MAINFPTSPANNETYTYGTQTWYWANNYGVWQGSTGASFSISSAAPSSPKNGDLWWNNDLGLLFIYYNDGDTSQWVSAIPSAGGGSGSATESLSPFLFMGA